MNKTFEDLVEDKEIRKVGYKAASSFKRSLTKEEIDSCVLNALWRSWSKFDPSKNTKFTSYLYKGVILEFLTLYKFNMSYQNRIKKIKSDMPSDNVKKYFYVDKRFGEYDIKDLVKNCDDPELIVDRFWNLKTLKEMADERGVSIELVRIRINKILKNFEKKID
jgi:DNA-directed RNA polymerase sigma subunit (sigma70/sigma32)